MSKARLARLERAVGARDKKRLYPPVLIEGVTPPEEIERWQALAAAGALGASPILFILPAKRKS